MLNAHLCAQFVFLFDRVSDVDTIINITLRLGLIQLIILILLL